MVQRAWFELLHGAYCTSTKSILTFMAVLKLEKWDPVLCLEWGTEVPCSMCK